MFSGWDCTIIIAVEYVSLLLVYGFISFFVPAGVFLTAGTFNELLNNS